MTPPAGPLRRFLPSVLLLSLCLVVGASSFVSGQGATCGFGGLDFTSLSTSDLSPNDGTPDPQKYTYSLRVCGVVSSPTCTGTIGGGVPTASACMVAKQFSTPYVSGEWTGDAVWSYVNAQDASQGVQYQLSGQKNCGALQLRTATVIFVCAQTLGTVTVVTNVCNQSFTIPTPLACAAPAQPSGSTKHGLSGGWVFIIILCVLIPVYVVGGCLYKSKRMGAAGIERCPNIDFWRVLPGLVKDGFGFTYRKLRGLCGGGGSGGGGETYATM